MQKPVIPITHACLAGLLLGRGFLHFPHAIAVLAVLLILTARILTRFES